MYSAIHVIQTELDITGTTAREATTTLTGSFASMKAAAQNVLGQMALGEDLQPSLEALVETARTYLVDNLLPLVVNAVGGIPEAIAALVPAILQTGTELLQNLTSGFAAGIPDFLSQALPAVLSFTEELRANFGDFVSAGIDLILSLANGLVRGPAAALRLHSRYCHQYRGPHQRQCAEDSGRCGRPHGAAGQRPYRQHPSHHPECGQDRGGCRLGNLRLQLAESRGKHPEGAGQRHQKHGVVCDTGHAAGHLRREISWIKSLPSQAVQWGKNLIQSFISGLNGTGTAATIATAGIQVAKTAAQPDTDWTLSDDVVDKAEVNAFRMQNLAKQVEDTIPAYTKSGNAATAAAQKAGSAAKTAASVVNSYSDTAYEVVGNTKRTIQTINEELSNGTTQQKQTITSTSRQMVDGVLKNVKTVETIAADGKRTVSQTMETVRDVVNTVTASSTAIVDSIKTTTQTVTKTLADGTTEQQRVITQTQDKVIDGALRTVETVKTIAADGTEQVAENIKDSAAKTLDGLWSELKDRANEGILGTVDTLWNAVKSEDWLSIGKWAASALYSGLTADQKQQLTDYALSLVDGLNGVLGQGAQGLAQGAASLGQQLFEGITGRFGDVASLAGQLSGTLQDTFAALKGPLGTAAKAISTALSGNLLSAFPTIFAAMGTLVTTVGSAFVAMLESIGAAISATGIGLPVGAMVIAAGVALAVAIAAIAMKLGSSSRSSVKTPNSSSGSGSAVTAPSYSLWDYEKETARPERKPRPSYEINQYIYSKAQTAADLMREARYEQERAVLAGV